MERETVVTIIFIVISRLPPQETNPNSIIKKKKNAIQRQDAKPELASAAPHEQTLLSEANPRTEGDPLTADLEFLRAPISETYFSKGTPLRCPPPHGQKGKF